ncbi:MAG: pseudouridine synthase [Nanoarchaeota archaeon]
MNRKQRLLKIVVQSRVYNTRLEAEKAIRDGKVSVDGKPLIIPDYQLDPKKRKVLIEGKPIKSISKTLYFAFNKPIGVTCEKNEVSNIYHFLRRLKISEEERKSLSCVGRLDKDTTGLIVFTNDGDFAHTLLQPKSKIPKTYEVKIKGYLTKNEAAILRQGVEIKLDDKVYKTLPCEVFGITGDEKATSCRITITEGKKRQIRKMFEALGHGVLDLKRVSIGKLKLENLPQGNFREIKKEDVLGSKVLSSNKKTKDDY